MDLQVMNGEKNKFMSRITKTILGLSIGETDGSSYPEIIVSTSYYALSQSEQTPHGYVHVYGFDGINTSISINKQIIDNKI